MRIKNFEIEELKIPLKVSFQHSTASRNETEAVLAHELGHFKRNHIKKSIVLMSAMSLAGLAILGWLINEPAFYAGLGIRTQTAYMGLLLFMLVIPLFTFFISPLFSAFSRKHEFEADDYAKQQCSAADLVSALVKMYEENASTLTPRAAATLPGW